MSTKKNVKVNLNNPTKIKCRAPGKWDKITSHTFTDWDQTYSIQMENYNGFNYSQEESFESPNKFNFSNTQLPWKWDYNFKLSTSKYCLMPVNGGSTITDYSYNFNVVGNIQINNTTKVVSNFSPNSWIISCDNFSPNNKNWEATAKVKTNSIGVNQAIFCSSTQAYQPFDVHIGSDGRLFAEAFVNYSSTELFHIYGTTVLNTNQYYWVTLEYNNETGYALKLSTDGVTFTTEATSSVTTPINGGCDIVLGADFTTNGAYWGSYFNGSMDLNETYIKVNNEYFWKPEFTPNTYTAYKNITESKIIPSNFDYYGNVELLKENNHIIGKNFTSANFTKLRNVFNPASNPWEMMFKIKTGSSLSDHWFVGSGITSGQDYQGVAFGIGWDVTSITFYLSTNGSSWDLGEKISGTTSLQTNTEYYAKLEFTGTEYNSYISTDGINWNKEATVTSSSSIYVSSQPFLIGGNFSTSTNPNPWNGSIDFSESYIKINGLDWWVPEFTKTAIGTMDTTQGTPKLNYDKQTIDGTSISGNNLIYSPNVFNPGNSSWEIRTKVITGSSFSGTFFNNPVDQRGIRVGQYPSNYWQLLISRGTSWINTSSFYNSYSANPNSPYWVKIGFDGSSRYYLDVSSDGNSYTRVVTYTSSYKIGGDQPIYFSYWNGEIDISETVVTIGGNIWWNPEILPSNESLPGCTYNYTDNGQETTLNAFVVDGDDSVVLTPDSSYTNGWKLGTVNVPEHDVYTYNDGEWSLVTSE